MLPSLRRVADTRDVCRVAGSGCFTGETRTGAAIMKAAADGIRDVSFELGGKNAVVIRADADLEKSAEITERASFGNAGQLCIGPNKPTFRLRKTS